MTKGISTNCIASLAALAVTMLPAAAQQRQQEPVAATCVNLVAECTGRMIDMTAVARELQAKLAAAEAHIKDLEGKGSEKKN